MNGIITITSDICAKILNYSDYVHYKKLLSDRYVSMHHPKVYGIHEDEKNNQYIVIMEKKGKNVSEYDNDIITHAKQFVTEYVRELHKRELYHGDIVYNGGNGVHLNNILYDEDEDTFYIIDFNSLSSVELEKKILDNIRGYCQHVLKKRKSNNDVTHNNPITATKLMFS